MVLWVNCGKMSQCPILTINDGLVKPGAAIGGVKYRRVRKNINALFCVSPVFFPVATIPKFLTVGPVGENFKVWTLHAQVFVLRSKWIVPVVGIGFKSKRCQQKRFEKFNRPIPQLYLPNLKRGQ